MVEDYEIFGEVWNNADSIANILSLAEVRQTCRVTMDSAKQPAIYIHRPNGSVMPFIEHEPVLYIYKSNDPTNLSITGYYSLLSTVAKHIKMFSRREVKAADATRELNRKIGRPDET